jgi:hypothetical protein
MGGGTVDTQQEGYYPLPGEIAQLFVASGFRVEDMLSLNWKTVLPLIQHWLV